MMHFSYVIFLFADKMKVALTVICLFGLAFGGGPKGPGHQGLNEKDTEMVNKMMDVIEGGLKRDEDADEKARALFISLTLTSTTTNLATTTITTTETASCVSNAAGGAFTECTDDSGSGSGNRYRNGAGDFIVDHIIGTDDAVDGEYMPVAEEGNDDRDGFEGELSVHKVVNGQNQKVSVSEILPTRVRIQQLLILLQALLIFLLDPEGAP